MEAGEPPSWRIADALIAKGCDGALIPSTRDEGGTNLVLWRWSAEGGGGARVTLVIRLASRDAASLLNPGALL